MKRHYLPLVLSLLVLPCAVFAAGQDPVPPVPPAQPPQQTQPAQPAPPATGGDPPHSYVIDQAIAREKALVQRLGNLAPLVETYIQNMQDDRDLGAIPKSDKYFLGKLNINTGVTESSLLPPPRFTSLFKNALTQFYTVQYLPNGFAQTIVLDKDTLSREAYNFSFVRKEFLGEVRCFVFEVTPDPDIPSAYFSGRIWVEDQDFNIVRFNGSYGLPGSSKMHFHMDSWRELMGPGIWLPAYVYTEESDRPYFFGQRELKFKAQTRLWGYNVGVAGQQDELTALNIESEEVRDEGDPAEGMSPVLSLRAWQRQAEDNAIHRMQKAGVVAPEGEVDAVLETVISNLEITNNLDIQPSVRARVLLTSPLESFTVGHTIMLSRGLVDVLPDEASLAMILAHELAHIVLNHDLDTKYAFHDRMLFKDKETFQELVVKREDYEEAEADEKALELLQNSPYKDKLASAGLFLRALDLRSAQISSLLQPHLGNPLKKGKDPIRMSSLLQNAPELQMARVDQIPALPLGGRIRVDPWNNTIRLVKAEPVPLASAREKMPFEVTPVFLYLTRNGTQTAQQTSGAPDNQAPPNPTPQGQ